MKDPYDTLEVPRDADGDQIKQAYRRRSRETHPDKGGTDEESAEVSHAYAILRDPEARAHYDATGEAPTAAPVLSPAEQLILNVLHGHVLPKGNLDDPLTALRKQLEQQLSNHEKEWIMAEQGEQMAEAQVGRFRREGEGENLLEASFRQMLDKARQSKENIAREMDKAEEALALLDSFEDTRPVEADPVGMHSQFFDGPNPFSKIRWG